MTIEYFADQQNLVLVPALIALLVATVLICLPIVFAPALRRGRRGRTRAIVAIAGVLAVVALVTAGWQAGVGVRTLQTERAALGEQLQARYGLGLTSGEVGELVDGGAPQRTLPALASRVGLARPTIPHALRLREQDADSYVLTYGGRTVPAAG